MSVMLRISKKLKLIRDKSIYEAGISVIQADLPELSTLINVHLHKSEKEVLAGYEFEKRKLSYALGRVSTKIALQEVLRVDTDKCWVEKGVFKQPILYTTDSKLKLQCSLSHSENMGVAIVFPEAHPLAVDIEKIDLSKIDAINSKLVDSEKELCFKYSHYPIHTILWTLKEALSKVIKCGLTVPFDLLEIDNIEKTALGFVSTYKNFFQYKASSFILEDNFAVSVVYPKHTEIDFEPIFKKLQSTRALQQIEGVATKDQVVSTT